MQKTLSNDLPSWDSGNGCRVSWSCGNYEKTKTKLPETNLDKPLGQQNVDYIHLYTLPETNIAPENGWLEYFLVSFWVSAYFQWLLLLVSGSVKTTGSNLHPPPSPNQDAIGCWQIKGLLW